jgi:hypothetical protein
MARRPKWWLRGSARPAPKQLEDYADDASAGVSPDLVDRAFWLDDDTEIEAWVTALDDLDNRGDKLPLLNLLRSGTVPSQQALAYLADMLERYQLKKRRGGQSTPAYNRTRADSKLALAINDVRRLVKRGTSVKDALEKVSKSERIPLEVLASAHSGRRSSTRRMMKRRP